MRLFWIFRRVEKNGKDLLETIHGLTREGRKAIAKQSDVAPGRSF